MTKLANRLKTSWPKNKPSVKLLHKKLVDVSNPCQSEKHIGKSAKDRAKYGVSYCDTYCLSSSFGDILANALYSYVFYAEQRIYLEGHTSKEIIEKHAAAIREWAKTDSFDGLKPKKRTYFTYEKDMADYEKRLKESEGKPFSPMKPMKQFYGEMAYKERMASYVDFKRKEKAWKEAMKWLTENWHSLWW